MIVVTMRMILYASYLTQCDLVLSSEDVYHSVTTFMVSETDIPADMRGWRIEVKLIVALVNISVTVRAFQSHKTSRPFHY